MDTQILTSLVTLAPYKRPHIEYRASLQMKTFSSD